MSEAEPRKKEEPPMVRIEAHDFERDLVIKAWEGLMVKVPFLHLGMANLSISEEMMYQMLKENPVIVKLEKERAKAARRGGAKKSAKSVR